MDKKIIAISLIASTLLASENLGTITVTSATKSTQSIEDTTSNIEVITAEELEEKKYTTIAQALNSITGINYTNNGPLGTTTSILIRGMDNKRVLVLIDGVNLKDPSSTSGASFAHIMMSDVERIEVVKGAQSSIWGNDATAGVINIITKKAKNGFHSNIELEKGSFNTNKIKASISNKTDKYDVKVSLARVVSDGFSSTVPNKENIDDYEDDNYQNTTINFATNYNITDSDKIGLNITTIDALANYDGWNAPNLMQRSDVKDRLYSIYYTKSLKEHLINIKYNNSDFFRDEMDTVVSTYVKEFNGNLQSFEITDKYQLDDKNSMLFGGSYEIYDVDYKKVDQTTNDKQVDIKSIFVTDTYKNNNFITNGSIRLDDFSTFGTKYTGKIGAKYLFTKELNINTNYGTAYNAPNIMELLNPWGAMANQVVTPEKTKSFDISLNYKKFTTTYFYNKVTDMIDWYDPDTTNSWTIQDGIYINRDGTSTFKGYELSYKDNITEDVLYNLSFTKLNAKNSDGEFIAKRPKSTFKFGVDYYGIDKLHINLSGEYIGTRYDKDDEKGSQTGRYTLLNSVINYNYNKDIDFYIKVDNLTDKYYQTSDGFATSPRAYYIGTKVSF